MVVILSLCMVGGCGKSNESTNSEEFSDEMIDKKNEEFANLQKEYEEILNNHEAMKMKDAGIWEERYTDNVYTSNMTHAELSLSVNEQQKMTEEQRLVILDYYNTWTQSLHDVGNPDYYDGNVIIYAVFYSGDKEVEEVARYKYVNGDIIEEITEEEQYYFPAPILQNMDD